MGSAVDNNSIALHRCADMVILSNTPKGRGVFATKDIPARAVIDVCPVLVLGVEENEEHIRHTSLYHYTYNWPVKDENGSTRVSQAVIFGLGSMFNHNIDQNVGWVRDTERLLVTYRTLRNITAGEELCISYGPRLTFKDADSGAYVHDEEDGLEQLNRIQLA
ncbi:SET domain-containing protein [Mytilinidion resinicola]|uniref:SET domain-containing protein n=1 Tax=Mytilinidion resinicola TaxID=574789 RepID=A0A6A6YKY1_9PEZI|nr:SET domain-containing protein [Mytilinidion resinicola]KAF2809532.1 SET domain-containing protein [Mytilinidion resinicola]